MGKTKQGSTKIISKYPKNSKKNFRNIKSQQEKFKPPKQNTAAELIEQKRLAKLEKERKFAQYKKKRLERTKVISKKTSRGQPLMKNRIEYLLKQIQEMKRS